MMRLRATWALCFGLGLLCLVSFVKGWIRDHHVGDPEFPLPLDQRADWARAEFRVWRDGVYRLHLSTVNHAPPFRLPYRGRFEVRLLSPSGEPVFRRSYDPGSVQHERPDNLSWSQLDSVRLPGNPLRRWTLEARVVEADPQFTGARSKLMLRRVRPEVGMEGIVNLLMIVPATLLLTLSLWPASRLARGGRSRLPLWLSRIACAIVFLIFVRGMT